VDIGGPNPAEVFRRAEAEGARRLDATPVEVAATGFIAGSTIVFGIVALGITEGLAEPALGPELAQLAGALAFGVGLVFLVAGRAELFTEDFLDPVVVAIEQGGTGWLHLARLWSLILVFNLVGGALLALIVSVDGALPAEAGPALARFADHIVARGPLPALMNAITAGALITSMTYFVLAVDSAVSRMVVAYLVGVVLALGTFNHVVVTTLHLLLGFRFGASVCWGEAAEAFTLSTAGNLLGGLGFVTLAHIAQVAGAGEFGGRGRRARDSDG
jgi:formate-nitrite transporter family protein